MGGISSSVGCATDIVWTIDKTLASVFEFYSQFSKARSVPGLGHVDSSRRWWKDLMISGITLTVGEVSSGWIRGVMKVTIGLCFAIPTLMCLIPIFHDYSCDDKRYTEKKNKSERARRKKEDIAKLSGFVDMTLR